MNNLNKPWRRSLQCEETDQLRFPSVIRIQKTPRNKKCTFSLNKSTKVQCNNTNMVAVLGDTFGNDSIRGLNVFTIYLLFCMVCVHTRKWIPPEIIKLTVKPFNFCFWPGVIGFFWEKSVQRTRRNNFWFTQAPSNWLRKSLANNEQLFARFFFVFHFLCQKKILQR